VFGLNLSGSKDLEPKQLELVKERYKAKQAKDWSKADKIRDELVSQGIGLKDTVQGNVWYRL